ncbi:DNA helicase [Armatimonas sp.]|uniref:DNA helicase n=1 Tax=Armatimonas sp. TaxID=1872638 RepID=UPI00374D4D22
MALSAPIYVLKQQAKVLSRKEGIPLHQALDRIASQEGFSAWSLLSAKTVTMSRKPLSTLLTQLHPGELALLGSRRGQGKTRLSLELAIQIMRRGGHAAFFTLDFTPTDVADCFKALGENLNEFTDRFLLDDSDQICADYILSRLASVPANTLVVIDYLQLLDQKRENPELTHQVQQLRSFARERQLIVLCLSQVSRSYDPGSKPCPEVNDIRLPNPLDLSLFDKLCLLNQDTMQIA